MKIKPECAICIIRQVVDAVKEITDDEKEQFRLIKNTMEVIKEVYGENAVPAWMGTVVHRHLKKISNNEDPYKNLKEKANKIALKYLDKVRELCNDNNDLERLRKKVLASIAGNVIDFGAYSTDIDIEKLIEDTLNDKLKIDNSKELLEDLKNEKIKKVLYICDNAGEIIFDRILIEEILKYNKEVVAVVKGKPILNDATLEDAKIANIDKICRVITTGSDIIGIILEECSEEFLEEFRSADLIIAKGMGNYESLTEYENEIDKPIYYILKAKCKPVAENIGVNVGDNILLKR
ncbi:damage-control phosphatase ARMT1 family protein [Methanocaldococcus sp.]